MNGLLYAHSGLRYLILLTGTVGTLLFLAGAARKQDLTKPGRILGAVFTGLVDLQLLLGLGSLMARPWNPMYIGHLSMMVLAAVLAHTLLIVNRRRATPGNVLPLIGVGLAMLLIVGGIFALGRGPLSATVFGG